MAITTNAITNSFKEDLLQGVQTFVAGGGDTFKLALYDSSASIGADTTSYAVGIVGQVEILVNMLLVAEHWLLL
jgi:hypothetical protein